MAQAVFDEPSHIASGAGFCDLDDVCIAGIVGFCDFDAMLTFRFCAAGCVAVAARLGWQCAVAQEFAAMGNIIKSSRFTKELHTPKYPLYEVRGVNHRRYRVALTRALSHLSELGKKERPSVLHCWQLLAILKQVDRMLDEDPADKGRVALMIEFGEYFGSTCQSPKVFIPILLKMAVLQAEGYLPWMSWHALAAISERGRHSDILPEHMLSMIYKGIRDFAECWISVGMNVNLALEADLVMLVDKLLTQLHAQFGDAMLESHEAADVALTRLCE
eukprot:CAMPEP_0168383598 /NCGR_PEP_ID=MMETSP0228-20121227/13984_1 /TAXON_ID=133427 /ORGANISM="Protoceratium reticulatum, Strain CCCM 535 (=CCMP 1889)" /LENGTH=274 /DNA_ID=CAMNT_0008396751 /DNA_START=58 /DNA_END=882 /DNA_ORIENTATION=-